MPSSALALQASMIGWAVRKSISATHRGMTSAVPNFLTRSSYLDERLWLRSMTSSKLYFIRDSFVWGGRWDRRCRLLPGCPLLWRSEERRVGKEGRVVGVEGGRWRQQSM